MELLKFATLAAMLLTLLAIAWRMWRMPKTMMAEATRDWKDAFVREIREARLENRKLHKAELASDKRVD